jgi:hypothetical protein
MWFLRSFQIILLFMNLILLVVNFCRTIKVVSVYFIVYALILLFVVRLGQWVLQY